MSERVYEFFNRHMLAIGQASGYGSGLAAWLGLAKDAVGLIGIVAGATLSVLSLVEYLRKKRRERFQASSHD